MISAKKARIKTLKQKARLDDVNYRQVRQLVKATTKAIKNAINCGQFEASIILPKLTQATFMYFRSILLSNCYFYLLDHNGKTLTVYWE